jgi:hypothetical protein
MLNVVQILGAVLILTAFIAAQFGWARPSSFSYLSANAIGSLGLTVTAVAGRDWGFVLLEGVWAAVSLVALARLRPSRSPDSASRPRPVGEDGGEDSSIDGGAVMAVHRSTREEADLKRARAAAKECENAAAELADFADRMSPVTTPAELAEFDELIAREAAAVSQRVEAFSRLGLGVGSLEATGAAEVVNGVAND